MSRPARLRIWAVVGTTLLLASCRLENKPNNQAGSSPEDEPAAVVESKPVASPRDQASPLADQPLPPHEPADLFDELQRLIGQVDSYQEQDAAELFNADRMFHEIQRQQLLGGWSDTEKTALRVALRTVIGDGLIQEGRQRGWQSYELERVDEDSANTEAVAIVRFSTQDGTGHAIVRFWICQQDGRWRMYDWADAKATFRASANVALALGALGASQQSGQIQALFAASKLAREGQFEEAEATLAWIVDEELPPMLQASQWMILAQTRLAQSEPMQALQCLARAAAADADVIGLAKMRASVHEQLGNHDVAIELAQQSLQELGDDPDTYFVIAKAHAANTQSVQAAQAYRRALELDAQSLHNLLGLAGVLSADQVSELAPYLRRLEPPAEKLQELGDRMISSRNASALDVLAEEYANLSQESPLPDYYRAEAMMIRGEHGSAADLLTSLATRLGDNAWRAVATDRLMDALLASGQPLEAYASAGSNDDAYQYVADRLMDQRDADGLAQLVAAHRQHDPEARLAFHEGMSHLFASRYEEAERVFADGMQGAVDDSRRDLFCRLRAQSLYKLGQSLSAYNQLGQSKAAFEQLAQEAANDRNTDALLALVAARRIAHPADSDLDLWEAHARLLIEDHAAAAELLSAAAGNIQDDERRRPILERALDAWLLDGMPVEAYRHSPDASQAFTFLASRLLDAGDGESLSLLVEEHSKQTPDDLRCAYYGGRAHFLQRRYSEAEEAYQRAADMTDDEELREMFRRERIEARYRSGQAQSAYEEFEPKRDVFHELARLAAADQKADELEQIIALHASHDEADPSIALWQGEVKWLRNDYRAVVDIFGTRRDALLSDPLNLDRYEDRLIRSLVRLKQFDEALNYARQSTIRDGDPWLEAVVQSAAGDVAATERLLNTLINSGYTVAEFYDDADIGSALRSDALMALRETLSPPLPANSDKPAPQS